MNKQIFFFQTSIVDNIWKQNFVQQQHTKSNETTNLKNSDDNFEFQFAKTRFCISNEKNENNNSYKKSCFTKYNKNWKNFDTMIRNSINEMKFEKNYDLFNSTNQVSMTTLDKNNNNSLKSSAALNDMTFDVKLFFINSQKKHSKIINTNQINSNLMTKNIENKKTDFIKQNLSFMIDSNVKHVILISFTTNNDISKKNKISIGAEKQNWLIDIKFINIKLTCRISLTNNFENEIYDVSNNAANKDSLTKITISFHVTDQNFQEKNNWTLSTINEIWNHSMKWISSIINDSNNASSMNEKFIIKIQTF